MPTDISDGRSSKLLHACKQSFHHVFLSKWTVHRSHSDASSSLVERRQQQQQQRDFILLQQSSFPGILVSEFPAGCHTFWSFKFSPSPPTRPCVPWLVLLLAAAATSTWRCESRGWHIDTAARWTPACSRSGSGTLAPDRPAGTRISGGRERHNIKLFELIPCFSPISYSRSKSSCFQIVRPFPVQSLKVTRRDNFFAWLFFWK